MSTSICITRMLLFTPYSGIGRCNVMLACKRQFPIPEYEWNS